MSELFGSRIACGNTAYKRVESDFYPTPPEVTEALMRFLLLPTDKVIWEPACGTGEMVRVMLKHGYMVACSDLNPTDFIRGAEPEDFLAVDMPEGVDWIITNPPFSIADKFIERCLEHKKPFALLLKSQYWHAKKRLDLFREHPPAYVLPLTWRPDFMFKQRGKGSPLMDVIWCVWDAEKTENTIYAPLSKPSMEEVNG
jgi:hypothetical protein